MNIHRVNVTKPGPNVAAEGSGDSRPGIRQCIIIKAALDNQRGIISNLLLLFLDNHAFLWKNSVF